jgi:hypothetical protein
MMAPVWSGTGQPGVGSGITGLSDAAAVAGVAAVAAAARIAGQLP